MDVKDKIELLRHDVRHTFSSNLLVVIYTHNNVTNRVFKCLSYSDITNVLLNTKRRMAQAWVL